MFYTWFRISLTGPIDHATFCSWLCKQLFILLALCSSESTASISMLLYIILFHHIGVCLHLCLSFACVCAIRHVTTWFLPTPTQSGCRSCTSIESVSAQVARPGKKAESSTDGSRCSSPSAPLQVWVKLCVSNEVNQTCELECWKESWSFILTKMCLDR